MKKRIFFTFTFILTIYFMQGGNDITSKITLWKSNIKEVLDAVVAIFAIGGGFLVFFQYMQGSETAQRNFIRFLSGLAIFGMVELIADFFSSTV